MPQGISRMPFSAVQTHPAATVAEQPWAGAHNADHLSDPHIVRWSGAQEWAYTHQVSTAPVRQHIFSRSLQNLGRSCFAVKKQWGHLWVPDSCVCPAKPDILLQGTLEQAAVPCIFPSRCRRACYRGILKSTQGVGGPRLYVCQQLQRHLHIGIPTYIKASCLGFTYLSCLSTSLPCLHCIGCACDLSWSP